jgi:hypothetical protein
VSRMSNRQLIPVSHGSSGAQNKGSDWLLWTILKKAWHVSGASTGGGTGGGGAVGGAMVGMVMFRVKLQLVLSRIILCRGMTSHRPKRGSVKKACEQ